MNSKDAGIMKEARAIFWPWCAVMIPGLLRWLPFPLGFGGDFLGIMTTGGFWVGIPLLATLSIGNDFEDGGFPLLLGQPGRMQIWAEKWIVLTIAVLTTAFAYGLSWEGIFRDQFLFGVVGGVWLIVSVCSAMYWTLVARSTLGGLILNLAQVCVIFIAVSLANWLLGQDPSPALVATAFSIGSAGTLGYGVFMVWLGRRKFAGLPAAEGIAGNESWTVAPDLMPQAVARWLNSEPNRGAWLDLIRREVRLLWPVWLLTGLTIGFLICMTPFRYLTAGGSSRLLAASAAAFPVVTLYGMLAAVLAGSLSLVGERTPGTRAASAPMPGRNQWLVQLAAAMATNLICVGAVVLIGAFLLGAPFARDAKYFFGRHPLRSLILEPSFLTFAAFWCASVIKGTIRATLWTFPVAGSVLAASRFGLLAGDRLRNTGILDFPISTLHPFPFSDATTSILFNIDSGRSLMIGLAALPLLLAVLQIRRFSSTRAPGRARSMALHLAPVLLVTSLCAFALQAPGALLYRPLVQMRTVLREAHDSAHNLPINFSRLDRAHPAEFTFEDLSKVSPPSELATRWLSGATIRLSPRTNNQSWLSIYKAHSEYFTTIQFGNNWECSAYGGNYFYCKSPTSHWSSVPSPEGFLGASP